VGRDLRRAGELGIGSAETLRTWERRDEVDGGRRPGVTTEQSEELKRLKRKNAELRRADEILKAAAAFFGAELDRSGDGDRVHPRAQGPSRDRTRRGRGSVLGVEPLCTVLTGHGISISPATFY
jgi:hypothetical protein